MNETTENRLLTKVLIEKILGGDTRAFGSIVRETEKLVRQIVFKMVDNAEDRRDLVQDVYFKVFQNLSGFKFQSKLPTWVGRIAYNTCVNHLSKKKLTLFSDLSDPDGEEDVHPGLQQTLDGRSPNKEEQALDEKERLAILQAEIGRLSPLHRTLIFLYHQDEMSYQEIGQITGLPDGTVKSYLFRARKALREAISKKYDKEEL
ncbi:MAG: sigma-70 family RNA polymerase sigma factor [Bacteroidetes bacterium]|nr:sigma-70 family RNA polymerase sigma factor [Bacteroidota bacterium]